MIEIGTYEAKTQLPALLRRVEAGESFVITRHGRAVARLGPVSAPPPMTAREAAEGLQELRNRLRARGRTGRPHIRELVEEGRE